ncbi:hypothetical protein ACPCIR_12650 [Mycobacterium sp. NPDC051198]
MTTPGGVPNLPAGALTLETLQSKLQDMSTAAMRQRAADRVPTIFNGSTGGSMMSDLSPFGILTKIWAVSNSLIAQADPADINGPEDLPPLLLEFIEGLPVIGELVGLLEAIVGTYDGDDPVLIEIQKIFGLIRNILGGIDFSDLPTPEEAWSAIVENFIKPLFNISAALAEALLTAPINLANAFGQLSLDAFGGGVSIADLTTVVPNQLQPFTATSVPTEDGWSYNATDNAAQVIADGTTKNLWLKSRVIKVESDQPLDLGVQVKYSGVTSGAGPTIRLVLETWTVPSPTNADTPTVVTVAAITNPSGAITTPVTLGNSSWPIPTGVKAVRPRLVVDELVTAGTVQWLNTPHLYKTLLGALAAALADINTALNNAGQATRDAIANALGHAGTGHTPANILTYLMNIPQDAVAGLGDVFAELADILDDQIIDPLTAVGNKLKDLVHRFFFGGGPDTVVSQKQIAEPTGVPPTDADNVIPWVYLPPELTSAAIGHPWVELSKAGPQTINKGAAQKLTAWTQAGGFPLTEPVGGEFRVPFDGLFHIKAKAAWAVSPDTYGRLYLSVGGSYYRTDHRPTDGMSNLGYNEIDELVPLSAGQNVAFFVQWDGTGTTRDISASPNTYVRITYIGATHLTATPIPTPTTTFDARGTEGSGGTSPTKITSHTFGPNANTIVIPISHTWSSPLTVTVIDGAANHNVPVLSGPTFIGTYFGFDAYYSLAAAILPTSVRGKTVSVKVESAATAGAWSFKSLSFNDVSYLGAVRTSSGTGGAKLLVPSNAFSQVAGGFGGMDVNFSSFNRTQDLVTFFDAGQHWAHIMGHAQGGLEFVATGSGKWAAKFIELHP